MRPPTAPSAATPAAPPGSPPHLSLARAAVSHSYSAYCRVGLMTITRLAAVPFQKPPMP